MVAAAAIVQQHTGGFEADAFAVCGRLAVIFAVLVMGRAWLLAEDELKELVVDTMLEVCLAEERAAFSSLKAVFLTKLDLRAIDRSRREQKTCALLPDYASCQFESFDSLREPAGWRRRSSCCAW